MDHKGTQRLVVVLVSWFLLKSSVYGLKDTSKILQFGGSDAKKSFAVLSRDPKAHLPASFTVCATIQPLSAFTNDIHVFFYLEGIDTHILLNSVIQIFMTKGKVDTTYNFKRDWQELESDEKELQAFPKRWIKQCASYNHSSGVFQVVVDGVFVANDTLSGAQIKNMPTDLTNKIKLGNTLEQPTTHTKLTNVNIYSHAHSVEVMRRNTKEDKCIEDGDYLAWKDMKLTLHGQVAIETVDAEEACMGEAEMVIYPASMNQLSCMQLCENVGTRAPPVTTPVEWLSVKKFVQVFKIWVAVDDKKEEGVWRDHYNNQVLNQTQVWVFWATNMGNDDENCATLRKNGPIGLDDDHCDREAYCMCQARPQSFLRLRGLCKQSAIDTHYQPKSNQTLGRLQVDFILLGLHTSIEHDEKIAFWNLSTTKGDAAAISKTSRASFTLGKHNWTISGDKGCSEHLMSDSYTIELKMSGCEDGNFTCNDGQCISMAKRCDQLPHCRDDSDEKGCEILVLKNGYNKNIPPIISKDDLKIPVNVNTSIDIFKLVDINEEDYSIEIQFQITMEWKENRVTYQNLKKKTSLNALTQEYIEMLWLPKIIFENTDQKDTTRLGVAWEWETNIDVKREGNYTISGLEVVDETYFFPGFKSNFNFVKFVYTIMYDTIIVKCTFSKHT